jgi:HPt (histidine-containing phosphotransfer) domain-containing protein
MFKCEPPIRSTQIDVDELAEDIDRFVIVLAERIDEIQDAELARCPDKIASLARQLSSDAERVGYPGMAQNAKSTAMAAEDGKIEAMQEHIAELTDLAQRIRRGHRGAA